jgi:hypothetical protein
VPLTTNTGDNDMHLIRLTLAATVALAAFGASAADNATAIDPLQLRSQVSEQVNFAARNSGDQNQVRTEEQLRLQEQQRLRERLRLREGAAEHQSHYGQGYESRTGTGFARPASGSMQRPASGGGRH